MGLLSFDRDSRIIFSHETDLYLHGLSDRESVQPVVTVKRGYNASHLKAESIKVYTVIPEWFEIGQQEIQTSSGNTVRAYDRERCICDILREKKRMNIQVFRTALNTYFQVRLTDTDNPPFDAVGMVVEHVLLLAYSSMIAR